MLQSCKMYTIGNVVGDSREQWHGIPVFRITSRKWRTGGAKCFGWRQSPLIFSVTTYISSPWSVQPLDFETVLFNFVSVAVRTPRAMLSPILKMNQCFRRDETTCQVRSSTVLLLLVVSFCCAPVIVFNWFYSYQIIWSVKESYYFKTTLLRFLKPT